MNAQIECLLKKIREEGCDEAMKAQIRRFEAPVLAALRTRVLERIEAAERRSSELNAKRVRSANGDSTLPLEHRPENQLLTDELRDLKKCRNVVEEEQSRSAKMNSARQSDARPWSWPVILGLVVGAVGAIATVVACFL